MGQALIVSAGGFRWQVLPEWRELLLGPEGLRLQEWLEAGAARPVKQGPHRSVYRLALPGLDCHIKHNRLMNARAWLREMVRPAKALIEYQRARAIARRGVPTFVPVAVGARNVWSGPGESFLVTLSLQGTQPLLDVLMTQLPAMPEPERSRCRQRLAVALGRFLAQVHRAGILHRDLHLGNLLFRTSTSGLPEFFVIDLHAAQLGGPLDWPDIRDNLVIFNRWFMVRAQRSDRLRFWHSYARCQWPDLPRHVLTDRARDLECRSQASNDLFWRRRDLRCRTSNRYFRRIRSAAAVGFALADVDRPVVEALLANPDAPFEQPGVKLLKDSPSSTVVELELVIAGTRRAVIYKRFRVTAASDPWLALLRRPAALRSWSAGHGLRDRGLPTPSPLVVLHRCRHGLYREGYLLTEKVPDAVDLHGAVKRLQSLPDAEGRDALRHLIGRVACLVCDLHDRRLAHRDLKAANILVQDQPGTPPGPSLGPAYFGPAGPVWLIDLVGVTRHRRLARARQVQNLARLHASFCRHATITRSDKLRFLRTYLRWGLHGRASWKRWWQEIERATEAKIIRNAGNRRPLT
jgi:tRNA A-37 threonylcarbamoyl transferase component Bud32